MYDILVSLFENCQQAELAYDRERVAKKLSAAGFDDSDISEALHWLAGVLRAPHGVPQKLPDSRTSFRAFAPRELAKLDAECRGFLLTLEQSGILNPQTRELVIERSLAATGDSLTLDQLKLIALMVCHALIKSGGKLVESAEDVLAELTGFRRSHYASTVESGASGAEVAAGLLAHMGHDPVDVDSLCARAGMSAEQVSSELLRLELDGRVTALPGGLFQRLEKGKGG